MEFLTSWPPLSLRLAAAAAVVVVVVVVVVCVCLLSACIARSSLQNASLDGVTLLGIGDVRNTAQQNNAAE